MSFCSIVSRQKHMDFLTDSHETMLSMILSKVCPKSSLPPRFADFWHGNIYTPLSKKYNNYWNWWNSILHYSKQVISFYALKFTGTKKWLIMSHYVNLFKTFVIVMSGNFKKNKCLRCFAVVLNVEIHKASNLAQARKLGQLFFLIFHISCINFECMNIY